MEKINLNGIQTNKYGSPFESISWLNQKIFEYVNNTYNRYGFKYGNNDKDLNVDGLLIKSEYISKMVNNYTIFKKMIEINNIKSESDFYHYMIENLYDIYNFKGKFFKSHTLPILINTSRKGNIGEKKSLDFFKNELKKKGINVDIIQPTIEEDVSGIDAKFFWNNKIVTIQVKPYDNLSITDGIVRAFSQGSLSLNTDYLILYKSESFIIIKGKDITISGNLFIFYENKISGKSVNI